MTFQHYIPATFLANFSSDTFEERRKRKVSVGDKSKGSIFRAPVSTILGFDDFYPEIVDESLGFYEQRLNLAINQLINRTIACNLWANTLIDFVAGILVRGPDFNDRFENRFELAALKNKIDPENTNYARVFEIQRLRASIIGAKWTVLQAREENKLIINDLGYSPYQNPILNELGMAIPINPYNVLLITPRMRGKIAIAHGGIWTPLITYSSISTDLVNGLNKAIDNNAKRFIIGENDEDITKYLTIRNTPFIAPEPFDLGFLTGKMAMVFEHMWLKFLDVISKAPNRDGDFIFFDFIKSFEEYEKANKGLF